MGGYCSTRWGSEYTRQTIDPLLFLDVRWLHRQGYLEPGIIARVSWSRRGESTGNICTQMNAASDTLTLIYRTQRPGDEWHEVRDPIPLDRTPCHYGGERPWFVCPGCQKRRAVLYSVGGIFRCRGCHNLAYSSTREDRTERSIRRANKLRERMGDTSSGYAIRPPSPKPRGMHWRTYSRLYVELSAELDRMNGCFDADIAELGRQVDKLTRRD